MSQRNVRGAYYVPTHDRKEDWDWLAKWQPNVIRYMTQGKPEDPNSVDVERVKRLHDTCPEAIILMRVWEIDDRNFAAHDAMVADPVAEAERQVDWWAQLFDRIVAAGVPREQLMAGLNNETGPEKDAALFDYTEAALKFGIKKLVRLCVYIFSVGRPSLDGESKYDITYFSRLDALIQQNQGVVGLNEYFQPEGMYAVWTDEQGNERKDYTYLIGRNTRWQIKADIIISEWGLDGLLYNRHPDKVYGNSGWLNFKKEWPPSRFADEYVECIRVANPNVIAICPFLEDWNDHKWQSFDLLEAYEEFLARKEKCVRDDIPTTPPFVTHLPAISLGKPVTAYVRVPSGANIRSAPEITPDNILTAVAYAQPVTVSAYTDDHSWARVMYQGVSGWMSSALLSPNDLAATKPVEPVTPAGDNWSRILTFLHKWEGGFQDVDWDAGNWTGCAVGKGQKLGTNHGISACGYPNLNIRDLSQTQADDIFRRDMYLALGIDKQPWPLCLLMMNAAVNFPKSNATEWLAQSGGDPLLFYALMLRSYRHSQAWAQAGDAWVDRMVSLVVEASA